MTASETTARHEIPSHETADNETEGRTVARSQLNVLSDECDRVAALSADDAEVPVPAISEWSVEKLVRHVTFVHRMACAALTSSASDGMRAAIAGVSKPERGPRAFDDYRESAATMLERYASVDPEQAVATWQGVGTPEYWVRRQLHEVTVHRFDLQDALCARGGPKPDRADPDAAADGVAEWAEAFLTRVPLTQLDGVAGRTVHLHTDDGTGMELFLDFTGDAVVVTREHRKGDVALRGSAEDMLLAVWRRRPLDVLDIVGDGTVAHALYDAVRI